MARRLTAATTPAWAGDLPVVERTLANGLKALVLSRRQAPVVVCDLYYPVGSVDEPAGLSGLAHFVEHMLFKGTERFPKGQIDRLTFLAAGQANAETGEDHTHYWFAFPADRWELALAVEADRMQGAVFDPREVEAERRVIAEERARELDTPAGRLEQEHLAVSYLVHPYRNPILGWPEDLRRATADDLHAFYRTHYRPDGAVLVLVGDVDPERALDRIEAHFGALPRSAEPRPAPPAPEPPQNGRREFTLIEPDGVIRGVFGWQSVPRGHADVPALDVLSDLLCCGRRSRLWDRLVERDRLALWVDGSQESSRLAGQIVIQVESAAEVDPDRLEAALVEELTRLAHDGPTPAELARSRNRLEAAWRWEQEDLAGLAGGLGQVALWGDWRAWPAEHRAALDVTAEQIRRVARRYLVDAGLTVGWARPGRPGTAAEPGARILPLDIATPRLPGRAKPKPASTGPLALAIPRTVARLTDYRPRRAVLPNGLRVLSERRPDTGVVALDLYCDAGVVREARPGLAHLVARLREEGTRTRSAEALAEAVEDIGGTLEVHPTGASLRVRAEDLPLAVEVLADLILRPAFPADRIAVVRQRIGSELRADRDDPAYRASLLFLNLIYGSHPFGRDSRGNARHLATLTRDDVLAHQAGLFAADRSFLVAVGDFEPARLKALVKTHFGGWTPAGQPLPALPGVARGARPRVRRVEHDGEQVQLILGHLGICRNDPDHDALLVLDHILGAGPGFTDRLSRVLRDELGLAYSVSGGITDTADLVPGTFRIALGTGPADLERARAAALEQLDAVHRGQFSDAEVDEARRYLAGAWVFDYQTVGQRAERLLELERWGLPLEDPVDWPERIARVQAEQVRAAAARHLHPEALVRVEYGPLHRVPGRRGRSRPRGR